MAFDLEEHERVHRLPIHVQYQHAVVTHCVVNQAGVIRQELVFGAEGRSDAFDETRGDTSNEVLGYPIG